MNRAACGYPMVFGATLRSACMSRAVTGGRYAPGREITPSDRLMRSGATSGSTRGLAAPWITESYPIAVCWNSTAWAVSDRIKARLTRGNALALSSEREWRQAQPWN